jgi:virginiamycin B lyase
MYVASATTNDVYEINPASGTTTTHSGVASARITQLTCCVTIASTPNLFGTENSINRIWYAPIGIGAHTDIPTPGSGPFGITVGPDFNIWFTEQNSNDIAINYPGSTTFKTFPIPTTNSGAGLLTTGPDGNLWFTEITANKVGVITP